MFHITDSPGFHKNSPFIRNKKHDSFIDSILAIMEELYEEDLLESSLDFDNLFKDKVLEDICIVILKKDNLLKTLIQIFRYEDGFNNIDIMFRFYVAEFVKPSPIDGLIVLYTELKVLVVKEKIHFFLGLALISQTAAAWRKLY